MSVRLGLLIAVTCIAAMPARASGPSLTLDLSSNDRVGFNVSGRPRSASVSAAFGMWSDDGALELGGFQDRTDPSIARAAEIVSGKPMQSRGVRLSGTLYERGRNASGWSLGVEARQQRTTDVGAALSGAWHTASDTRLSVNGKLKF